MKRRNHPAPSLADQIAAVERCLGRALPHRLRDLYVTGAATSRGLLPLATGREYEASSGGSPADRFLDAQERLASVLGKAIGHLEFAGTSDDDVWPPGLLVVEDVGCGIYRGVDLDDPKLRIVEYEHFEPVDDPDSAAGADRIAFREPVVPRALQHRFTVIADSLEDWLRSGAVAAR